MLTIIISKMLAVIKVRNTGDILAINISRNAGGTCPQQYFTHKFQKCWRHLLTIILFRIAGDKCEHLEFSEMLAANIINANFQKYWRQTLASICFFYYPELLSKHVSSYHFQKCWPQMLAIVNFRNTGDKCKPL